MLIRVSFLTSRAMLPPSPLITNVFPCRCGCLGHWPPIVRDYPRTLRVTMNFGVRASIVVRPICARNRGR